MFPTRVEYTQSVPIEREEFDDFMTDIKGKIFAYDADVDREREVGFVEATYFCVDEFLGGRNNDIHELFDLDGDDNYFIDLYGSHGVGFSKKILKRYGGVFFSNDVLVLKRLSIAKEARGNSLGLTAMRLTIENYIGDAQLVCLQAAPLQFSSIGNREGDELEVSCFTQDKKAARDCLCDYYSQLGFWRFDDDGVMVLSREDLIGG